MWGEKENSMRIWTYTRQAMYRTTGEIRISGDKEGGEGTQISYY